MNGLQPLPKYYLNNLSPDLVTKPRRHHTNQSNTFPCKKICSKQVHTSGGPGRLLSFRHTHLHFHTFFCFNTSYLADSYISFTLKLKSRQNFCSNSLIRSSTYGKKNISDFPPCGKMVVFVTEFVIFLKTSISKMN